MICPECGHERSKVIDSRGKKYWRWRIRKCRNCGKKYTTYETLASLKEMKVVINNLKFAADYIRKALANIQSVGDW